MALLNAARLSLGYIDMKTIGRKLVGPALAATGVATADEVAPADVGQGVMGLGSKLLTRLGGAAGLMFHSKDLNEGEDDPNSPYQKARMEGINASRVKRGKEPVPNYAKGGGIESRGKTKGTVIRMASGGSVSARADGIASKGKTRGKMC